MDSWKQLVIVHDFFITVIIQIIDRILLRVQIKYLNQINSM